MKDTIGTGDTEITRADAEALREDVIVLRDEYLKEGDFAWAVTLSHCIAFMANAIERIWHPDGAKVQPEDPGLHAIVEKMKADLAWRGPNGKPVSIIAVSRAQAAKLVQHLAPVMPVTSS